MSSNANANANVQVALSTAELQDLPTSATKEYTPDLMPFHIEHNGPAPISTYMQVSKMSRGVGMPEGEENDGGERYTSTFRGRTIHGIEIPVPAGYSGLILERREDGSSTRSGLHGLEAEAEGEEKVKGRRSLRSDRRSEPQKAEESPLSAPSGTSRVVVPCGIFSGLRVWAADMPVDGGRDEYVRSVEEWTALADEIHREA